MDFLDMIGVLFVAVVGTWMLWFLGAVLLRSLFGSRLRLPSSGGGVPRSVQKRVQKADRLIEVNQYDAALKELERSFLLKTNVNQRWVDEAKKHNHSLLSRLMVISSRKGGLTPTLPLVEKLLMERHELQTLLVKTKEARSKTTAKWEEKGKDMPNWTKTDYRHRVRSVIEELERNHRELLSVIKKLFDEVRNPTAGKDDIIYH